jgi:cytochrome c-type protein NapC
VHKLARKFQASYIELPAMILGTIDTPEKFEANRMRLAMKEGKHMKKTDSRECRNCHAMDHMDLEVQGKNAKNKHSRVLNGELNKTCIDCHKGIAHTLPEDDTPANPVPGAC